LILGDGVQGVEMEALVMSAIARAFLPSSVFTMNFYIIFENIEKFCS
jgi:hypothetical protein